MKVWDLAAALDTGSSSDTLRYTSLKPHTWQHSDDTHLTLAHFKKDRRKSEEPNVSEHISRVGDMAVGHIAGLAFGGLRSHSPSEHVEDPNVLVIHSAQGVAVYQGRPLCNLQLSPYHTTHADINADGSIDHIRAVVNPGEERGGVAVRSECITDPSPPPPKDTPLHQLGHRTSAAAEQWCSCHSHWDPPGPLSAPPPPSASGQTAPPSLLEEGLSRNGNLQ